MKQNKYTIHDLLDIMARLRALTAAPGMGAGS